MMIAKAWLVNLQTWKKGKSKTSQLDLTKRDASIVEQVTTLVATPTGEPVTKPRSFGMIFRKDVSYSLGLAGNNEIAGGIGGWSTTIVAASREEDLKEDPEEYLEENSDEDPEESSMDSNEFVAYGYSPKPVDSEDFDPPEFKGSMNPLATEIKLEEKEAEFLSMKQSNLSLIEYKRKFDILSHYAPHLVDTKECKAQRFKKRLQLELYNTVALFQFITYSKILQRVQLIAKDPT
ncbi:hypothetical protein FNV43_RR16986 [Rhamnella rubrinervis]|uniref:Retrotransposon gag domain-containing protein n=1 Tax=Rhamnella rubrinervis TaxID=2594499 RepID=A0A8K0GZV0_9ROSA|nr:hypothetical protein FNV43_RR16986 [Rhamnella rubrinervis]